jgi:hypothetical protein
LFVSRERISNLPPGFIDEQNDENVDRVKELGFETKAYIFLNLLMSGNSVWVSPEHFERQSNYALDVR